MGVSDLGWCQRSIYINARRYTAREVELLHDRFFLQNQICFSDTVCTSYLRAQHVAIENEIEQWIT